MTDPIKPRDFYRLTPAELETLQMVADGLSNREIAAERGCAVDTVRTHVATILRKYQVHSKYAAVAAGFRRGVIH